MARKVFISVLGTNAYLEARYHFEKKAQGDEEALHFVQEKIIKNFCLNWSKNDQLLFFLTDKARENNWAEKAQKGQYEGLSSRLAKLNLNCPYEDVDIPDGLNDKEIWEIFDAVFKRLQKGDDLYFDITHSFRMLPMVIMVLINYAKFLKDINVKSITYGAFEKLGPTYKVREMPVQDRWVQILELKQLSLLQDYTNAANVFVNHGAVTGLTKLFPESQFSVALTNFSDAFLGCRGVDVYQAESAMKLREQINELDTNVMCSAEKPIIESIRNKVEPFENGNIVGNGINAVQYCIDHGLIQQAITLLTELMVTYTLVYVDFDWKSQLYRNIASNCLNIKNKERYKFDAARDQLVSLVEKEIISCEEMKIELKKHEDLVRGIYELPFKESLTKKIYSCLAQGTRNDINHAGIRKDPKPTQDLYDSLNKYFIRFKNIVTEYPINHAPKSL